MISGQITSNTKLLMERDIRARVTKLAPFLQFDADPYPVVLGNRTVWIMDGYTTTDQYPYGQSLSGEGSLAKSFNYVRNSVKVTVDAYQGTVKFYVFDKTDPIIKSYRSAFPDLFTDGSQMPAAIRAHLRYPEDLFKSQSSIFGRYHVTEPKRFYDGSSKWLVSPDPGSGRVVERHPVRGERRRGPPRRRRSNQPQAATSTGARIEPYYLNIRLPGQKDPNTHFIVTVPFVPVSSGNSQTRLGVVPDRRLRPGAVRQADLVHHAAGQTVLGPVQVNNAIIRTSAISTAITLLNQQGSQIIQGSMQLIPVGNSIVYVRPFYAQGRGSGAYPAIPVRRRVLPGLRGLLRHRRCRTASTRCSGAHRRSPPATCRRASSPAGPAPGRPRHDDHAHHHAAPGPRRPPPRRPAPPSRRRPGASRSCSTRRRPSSTKPRRRSTAIRRTSGSTSGWSPRPESW